MYHSLQYLDVARDLARETAQQARSATTSPPSTSRLVRMLAAGRLWLAPARTRYA